MQPPPTDPGFPIFAPRGIPFADPYQSLLDSIRVFDQIFGGVLIVMLLFLIFHSAMVGRKVISIGMLFLVVSVVGTEFEALGTQLTYRLVINTIGVLVVAAGIWTTYTNAEP